MISKEFDRAGLPNAHINAFMSIAQSVGANRIVIGGDFTEPTGNSLLPPDREEAYRVRILEKALEAMMTDVKEPTIFNVRKDDSEEGV